MTNWQSFNARNIQFLTLIQDYREISKLLSTYIKILPELVNEDTKTRNIQLEQYSIQATRTRIDSQAR